MMRALVAVAACCALAAPALAQPQMPDPRQMSGIARPQQGDAAGTLTVRVLQGRMEVDAFGNAQTKFPPGQVVHLIAVGSDGTVALDSKPVDAGGRAVFTGLATDGTRAYYAATLLARGEVDDRLVTSEPIAMPPQVGMRVMLAGLDPASTDPPVDDLGDPRVPARPEGEVIVEVRGALAQVSDVRLVDIATRQAMTSGAQARAEAKVARFTGVPGGNDKVFVAEVIADGHVYRSKPIQLGRGVGAFAAVFVYPKLLMQFHSGAEVDDDKLWFQVQFTLANGTGAPYLPDGDGIMIPLPRGFVGASVGEQDQMRIKVISGEGFLWRGAFPPGQRAFVAQFAIPIDGGVAELDMPMPYGALESQISLRTNVGVMERLRRCVARGQDRKVCDAVESGRVVETEQSGPMRFAELDGGTTFLVVPIPRVSPGDRLRVKFVGLPSPPGWYFPASVLAGVAVVLFAMLAAVGMFMRRRQLAAASESARIDHLTIESDKLFDRLVKLEHTRAVGKVPDAAYDKQRAELKSKLVDLQRQIRSYA